MVLLHKHLTQFKEHIPMKMEKFNYPEKVQIIKRFAILSPRKGLMFIQLHVEWKIQ